MCEGEGLSGRRSESEYFGRTGGFGRLRKALVFVWRKRDGKWNDGTEMKGSKMIDGFKRKGRKRAVERIAGGTKIEHEKGRKNEREEFGDGIVKTERKETGIKGIVKMKEI